MAAPADAVLSPDSKQARDLAEGLVKHQAIVRASQLGGGNKALTDWIMKVPMEGAKTASRLLQAMMSNPDENETYIFPNKINQGHINNFIASARQYGPADEIPDVAAQAKAWAEPWIRCLDQQAHKEGEYFNDAAKRQLFQTSAKDEEADSKTDSKASKEKEVNQLMSKYCKTNKDDGIYYFDVDPSQRVNDKLITKLDSPAHGILILPTHEDLTKVGFASPPRPGCEAEVSLVQAAVGLILVRYRHDLPSDTEFGSHDDSAHTFIQETPDGNGGYKQVETKVFFDVQAYKAYCRKCEWPAGKIQDKAKRLQIAKKMWGEIMSECSRLGRRSLTSVFYKLTASQVFVEAEEIVKAEVRTAELRASASGSGSGADKTPSKKQRSERNQNNSDPPKGKCRNWCKGVPCKFTDKSLTYDCLKFSHDADDYGRWPHIRVPSGKSRSES